VDVCRHHRDGEAGQGTNQSKNSGSLAHQITSLYVSWSDERAKELDGLSVQENGPKQKRDAARRRHPVHSSL